jgi:hypothetical protein
MIDRIKSSERPSFERLPPKEEVAQEGSKRFRNVVGASNFQCDNERDQAKDTMYLYATPPLVGFSDTQDLHRSSPQSGTFPSRAALRRRDTSFLFGAGGRKEDRGREGELN